MPTAPAQRGSVLTATIGRRSARRSLGELFGKLSTETSTLIRQEMALARAELIEKGKEAGKGAGLFGGAGVVGLLAAGALTACTDPAARSGHGRRGWRR